MNHGSHSRRCALGIALLLAVVPLISCAPKKPAPTMPPPPPPDYSELYERLEESRLEYQAGIELIVAGEELAGEDRTAAAAYAIRADTEECARSEGCDLQVFLDAYDQLLNEQSFQLKMQAMELTTIQSEAVVESELEAGASPYVSAMPEIGRTVSLLNGNDLRDLIKLNGPVSAAIDDWLTWMRPMLMASYENYMYLRSKIAPVYDEAGLPEALLFAMIATETGGKVHAYSRAGAAGLLQFMPYTGRKYGLRKVEGFDQRLDPVMATRANVAYLNDLFADLNDSLEKALAAYNSGDGRLRRLNNRLGGASIWESEFYYSLPRETREYVPRVLAAAWLFMHPEDYNLIWPEIDAETAELELLEDIAIGELTICLGQELNPDGWFRTIRNLNPELDPGERVKAGEKIEVPAVLVPVYEARCLEGELLERARYLHEENYPDEPEMIIYTVRKGDTLGRIARKFRCVSIEELAAINHIRAPRYVIQVGQRLKIPPCR